MYKKIVLYIFLVLYVCMLFACSEDKQDGYMIEGDNGIEGDVVGFDIRDTGGIIPDTVDVGDYVDNNGDVGDDINDNIHDIMDSIDNGDNGDNGSDRDILDILDILDLDVDITDIMDIEDSSRDIKQIYRDSGIYNPIDVDEIEHPLCSDKYKDCEAYCKSFRIWMICLYDSVNNCYYYSEVECPNYTSDYGCVSGKDGCGCGGLGKVVCKQDDGSYKCEDLMNGGFWGLASPHCGDCQTKCPSDKPYCREGKCSEKP